MGPRFKPEAPIPKGRAMIEDQGRYIDGMLQDDVHISADAEPSGRTEQREEDDCTICAIVMATGLPYEAVMAQAKTSSGGYRYGGTPGVMSPKGVLIDLGFAAKRLGCEGDGQGAGVRGALWGRRAILSVPSLNGFKGHHDVYWDGHRVRDPSPKARYPETLPTVIHWATVLDETAPAP